MEYKILTSNAWTTEASIKILEKKVNELIGEGWEPVGGFVISPVSGYVYQTLIKR